jgi:hypothetical protein
LDGRASSYASGASRASTQAPRGKMLKLPKGGAAGGAKVSTGVAFPVAVHVRVELNSPDSPLASRTSEAPGLIWTPPTSRDAVQKRPRIARRR